MTDQARHQQTHLVDALDHSALLNLAIESEAASNPRRAYALPSIADLAGLFPELQFEQLIGVGGMGCVFRATQTKLDRVVAVKILPKELAADDLFAERFSREARAMARLNHPHIIRIYDYGKAGDVYFLVMEYMDGMNLRELIDAGRVPPDEACRIFESVCAALQYAHSEGVVHRDIKPENILFSRLGHVTLADFGLARLAMDSHCEVSLTQTRQAMGTLNYMAPEQWENPKSVDFRADIYAMGILLYELLTGRVPRGRFAPASSMADVPQTVDEVIHQAMQVEPSDRFESVVAMCDALRHASGGRAHPNDTAGRGTFTRLAQLGGIFCYATPQSHSSQGSGNEEHHRFKVAVTISLIVFLSSLLLLSVNWVQGLDGRLFGPADSYARAETVLIPNTIPCLLTGVIFVLNLCRRRIHPIRADLLSLLFSSFAIAQLCCLMAEGPAISVGERRFEGYLTIFPFVMLGIVILQVIEILFRLLAAFFRPVNQMVRFQ